MVGFMLSFSFLPSLFWEYASGITIYLVNKVSTKSALKTPFELRKNFKPSLKHI